MQRCWHRYHQAAHAQCSLQRFVQLKIYSTTHATTRHVSIALLGSPLLPLLMMTLIETIPLAPPSTGLAHSHLAWVRALFAAAIIAAMLVLQLHCMIPELGVQLRQGIAITVIVATSSVLYTVALATQIGYPVPFTFHIGSSLFVPMYIVCVVVAIGKDRLQVHRSKLKQYGLVLVFQAAFTVIYPLLSVGFVALDGTKQVLFTLLIPTTKFCLKKCMAQVMATTPDLKPLFGVLNAEVFNALFVSICMQNSSSGLTTALLLVWDLTSATYSLYHIDRRARKLETLLLTAQGAGSFGPQRSFPPLIDGALYLLQNRQTHDTIFTKQPPPRAQSTWNVVIPSVALSGRKRVAAMPSPMPPTSVLCIREINLSGLSADHRVRLDTLSQTQRVQYVQQTLELVHKTEMFLLCEYVEVVVPVIYSIYLSVVFHLPNREFHLLLCRLTPLSMANTTVHVMLYALLELLSFLPLHHILRKRLGLPAIHQLTFVLSTEWWLVQAKLTIWLVYMIQTSLQQFGEYACSDSSSSTSHSCIAVCLGVSLPLGVDFTFRFAWLHGGD